jgi:hypothetical protein
VNALQEKQQLLQINLREKKLGERFKTLLKKDLTKIVLKGLLDQCRVSTGAGIQSE